MGRGRDHEPGAAFGQPLEQSLETASGGSPSELGEAPGSGVGPSFHAYLTQLEEYRDQVAGYYFFPPRRAVFADGAVAEPYAGMLARLGLVPYLHQARGFAALAAGEDLVVATPTASGKSLLFQLPALAAAAAGKTSILIYPTKALAHDQLGRLRQLAARLELPAGTGIESYDGDTAAERRAGVRDGASCVLTNPDMLHYGVLPYHHYWADFLARLDCLVLDELHAYRGVLGTHVANIVRRLLRVAQRYGASPKVIAASATVGNPGEHAARLSGREFEVVASDDAPAGAREFVFWRPPPVEGGERRRSANSEAAMLAAALAKSGIKSLLFCNSRKSAELVRRYAAGSVEPEVAATIQSYRAGYTAEDRRLIEAGFKNGDITVLTATSALELGMDIGGVDAVVMVGYPGSKMAMWQRAGRAGRSGRRSLALLIAGADPLDEYYLHNPERLIDGPIESAVADPFNTELHPLHVECAAAESLLHAGEPWLDPALDLDSVPGLRRVGEPSAGQAPASYTHFGRYPHRRISVRGSGGRMVRLKDGMNRALGVTSFSTALRELHPGAVYLHQGETYLVAELDLEHGLARLLPHIEDYYTQVRSETDIEVLEVEAAGLAAVTAGSAGVRSLESPEEAINVGRVRVRQQVTGYVRKRHFSEAVLGEHPLDLPEVSYLTQALWFSPEGVSGLPLPAEMPSALHALEHTLIQLLPAFVLCERADVGGVSYPYYPPTGSAMVFVYDGYPGGVGYIRAGGLVFLRWLEAARQLLHACPCKSGCPRCVLSPKCGNGNQYLDKQAAAQLSVALLGRWQQPAPASA